MLMALIDMIKISEMFFCVFMHVENQYQMEFLKNLLIIQSILTFDFFFKPNFLLFKSLALYVSEALINKKKIFQNVFTF